MCRWMVIILSVIKWCFVQGSNYHVITREVGEYKIKLMTSSVDNEFRLKWYDESTKTLYMEGSQSDGGEEVNDLYCMNSNFHRVVTGLVGCDNVGNPSMSIISSNCVKNMYEFEEKRENLEKGWFMRGGSKECVEVGGTERECLGPLFFSIGDDLKEYDKVTVREVLGSRGQFLVQGSGPHCAGPTSIAVDIEPISIAVVANGCSDYDGVYEPYYLDSTTTLRTTVLGVFKYEQKRLIITKDGESRGVKINLGVVNGSSMNFYDINYETEVQGEKGSENEEWYDKVFFGEEYEMKSVGQVGHACDVKLEVFWDGEVRDVNVDEKMYPWIIPKMKEISDVDETNYYLNELPVYNRNRVCNFHYGVMNENNVLKTPFCYTGDRCGGFLKYETNEFPYDKISVEGDERIEHSLSCADFYPFERFSVGEVDIEVTQRYKNLCFAPFYHDVENLDTYPFERYKQCHDMGGFVYGRARNVCARSISEVKCKEGWIYYDQHCYFKLDLKKDARYKVSASSAEASCSLIFIRARPMVELTERQRSWITSVFMNYESDQGEVYRIQTSDTNCKCFTRDSVDESCGCASEQFPICRYHVSKHEPYAADMSMALETVTLLKYGQDGSPFGGDPAACKCFQGWSGTHCTKPTCPLEDVLLDASDDLSIFFSRCYYRSRGTCELGDPRSCACTENNGPSISYDTLDVLPCTCPSSQLSDIHDNFTINDIHYRTSILNDVNLPCSGTSRGRCWTSDVTLDGFCECSTATSRALLNTSIPLFNGPSCSCPAPIVPAIQFEHNSFHIQSKECNLRGSCTNTGCKCNDGFGGSACTCVLSDTILCGYNSNPFSHRFITLSFQQFIPPSEGLQGCTTSGCFCDPSHTGFACKTPISSKNSLSASLKVCGQDYPVSRGHASLNSTNPCTCNPITSSSQDSLHFHGSACQCSIDSSGQTCSGNGICENPSFPYGFCEMDLTIPPQTPFLTLHSNNFTTCDNPIYRLYTYAHFLYGNSDLTLQCPDSRFASSSFDSYGAFFGIFEHSLLLDFSSEWDHRHELFISSFLQYKHIPLDIHDFYSIILKSIAKIDNVYDLASPIIFENRFPLINIPEFYTYDDLDAGSISYLKDFWMSHLSRRRCSSDNQCETYGLGKCKFPSTLTPWLNRPPGPLMPSIGNEGGCSCFSSYSKGFYDPIFLCNQCTPGFGPDSSSSFDDRDLELFSNSGVSIPTSCSLPYGISSIGDRPRLCAGNGFASISHSTSNHTFHFTHFSNTSEIILPKCKSYTIESYIGNYHNELLLNFSFSSPSLYLYHGYSDILTIIGQDFFLNGNPISCSNNSCFDPTTSTSLHCNPLHSPNSDLEITRASLYSTNTPPATLHLSRHTTYASHSNSYHQIPL